MFGFAIMGKRKIIPVLQSNAVECGAACLTMICNGFGKNVTLDECVEQIRSGRGGTSAADIQEAALSYGLSTNAYAVEPDQIKDLNLPAIIHWGFNHFVVLENWTKRKIIIVDPSKGRREVTRSEFEKNFTGVILTFEEIPDFKIANQAPKESSLWFYFNAFKNNKSTLRIFVMILLASFILQLFGLTLPLFTKFFIDTLIPAKNNDLLAILGIAIIAFVSTKSAFLYLRSTMLLHLQIKFDSQITSSVFYHLLSLPYSFFQLRTSGDIISRLNSNVAIRNIVTYQMISTIIDGGLIIFYFVVLLIVLPSLALVTFAIGIIQLLLAINTSVKTKSLLKESLSSQAELQAYQVEALKGIATLKASGSEIRIINHWYELFIRSLNNTVRKDHFFSIIQILRSSLDTLAPLLLIWLGTSFVINGSISLGTMLAFNALSISFLTPLTSLANSITNLYEGSAHADRVMKILATAPEQTTQKEIPSSLSGKIRLKDIWFGYERNKISVIKNINIEIKAGQKIAIVGATGAGKSTLGMLLVGLYLPQKGIILYDNYSLVNLDLRILRNQIGVVLQEPFLFSGSIRQNIAFNNPDMNLEKIVEAARKSAIDREITAMPMGYDTMIAEGGASLSGGQKQRIALARALANDPIILLLDEATSHLDAETEHEIDKMLDSLSCTRIFIAHRLSTIINADLILFMKNGEIIERGTHSELLNNNDEYVRLFKRQFPLFEQSNCK
jgi:ATP-binding cassette subfamily B protein